jgi:hypothetical protein
MLAFVELVLVGFALCIGAAAGFYKEWRKGPPPPVTVHYCTPASTDPPCVAARAQLAASARAAVPSASAGGFR